MLLPLAVRGVAVAAMLAVAAYHLARLSARRRGPSQVALDLTHLAMAAAMIAMLAGRLDARTSAWTAVMFAVPAVWLIVRAVHGYVMEGVVSPLAAQAVGCCGMVAMLALAAASAGRSTSGTSTAGISTAGMPMSGGLPVVPAVLLVVPMAALTFGTATTLRRRAGRDLLAGSCQLLMAGTTTLMAAALL